MNESQNTIRTVFTRSLTILVLFLFLNNCSGDNRRSIPPYLRELPQELAYHLVNSDDSTFFDYAREIGPVPLSDAVLKIHVQISQMPLEEYKSSYDDITAYEKRIVRFLSESKLYGTNLADFNKRHNLPPDSLQLLYKLQNTSLQIYGDPDLSAEEKVEQYLTLLEAFNKFGDKAHIGLIKTKIFRAYADLGMEREYLHYLRSAISDFYTIEHYSMVCQCLGVLGYIHRKTGDIDSMIVCYNKANRIANQYKIPNQAARILNFYSAYYYDRGRLAVAHNLRKEALKICREYKGDYYLMTPLVSAMKFYVKLECWDVVSELLEHARVLERLYEKDYDISLDILRNRQMEAHLLMARGDVTRADALYRGIERQVKELPYQEEYPNMLRFWSQGLIGNGHWKQALNPIHEGFKYSIQNALHIKAVTFALLMAQAEYHLGHGRQFELALEHFDHYASEYREEFWREWVIRDALEGMYRLDTGQMDRVVYMLDNAIKRLQTYVMNTDASTHSYLWLNKSKEMKQFLANATSHNPSLGYGADLFWRQLYQDLGACSRRETDPVPVTKIPQQPADSTSGNAGRSILTRFQELSIDVQKRVAELDAVHCMYRVTDDVVTRWTVSKAGIRYDTLSCTPDMLRGLVSDTYSRILDNITKNGTRPPPALIKKLRELAELMLPDEILRPSNKLSQPLLLITPDNFLNMIPFETLNVGPGESYAPLLLHYDVAYMRYMNPPGTRDESHHGLILAYGGESSDLQKRNTFNPELAEVSSEASAVAVMDPDAILLSSTSATKASLMRHWEDVSYVYIATHIIRDPQVPYLVHIPLAFPGGDAGPEAAYLDITDIRSADLTGCEIVVLSGCGSGAPYIESHVVGPSLADAFLDAGAGAVVQTFWNIRDEDARDFMSEYVRVWNDPQSSKVHSLCEIKRRRLEGEHGIRHPSHWAAYSIKLGRP